jgi:hypothetical protein
MSANSGRVAALLTLSMFFLIACHDKGTGNEPVFPTGGTTLYIADCSPYETDQESIDLVTTPSDACTANILFYAFYGTAIWHSDRFRAPVGRVTEGCRLVFQRSISEAEYECVFHLTIDGLANHITRRILLPIGETSSIIDISESNIVNAPEDSLVSVTLSLYDSTGNATLITEAGNGSSVFVGIDPSDLCTFKISLGLGNGTGRPGTNLNLSYLNANGDISTSIFFDNTNGAAVDGAIFRFGPLYGLTYLAAASGGCTDTIALYAVPSDQNYRTDLLTAAMPAHYGYLSDGATVWGWDYLFQPDSVACVRLTVTQINDVMVINHPVYDCTGAPSVDYDQHRRLIWVIARSAAGLDTAWGYSRTGHLDTVETAASIPTGYLCRGQWINTGLADTYLTYANAQPFLGGSSTELPVLPTEISYSFGGDAGIGKPGAAKDDNWSINTFDQNGRWTGHFSLDGSPFAASVRIIAADSVVVYYWNGSIRALIP